MESNFLPTHSSSLVCPNLRCLQINLHNSKLASANLSQLVLDLSIDIVLIQEPYAISGPSPTLANVPTGSPHPILRSCLWCCYSPTTDHCRFWSCQIHAQSQPLCVYRSFLPFWNLSFYFPLFTTFSGQFLWFFKWTFYWTRQPMLYFWYWRQCLKCIVEFQPYRPKRCGTWVSCFDAQA